jgi:hypothetical protein
MARVPLPLSQRERPRSPLSRLPAFSKNLRDRENVAALLAFEGPHAQTDGDKEEKLGPLPVTGLLRLITALRNRRRHQVAVILRNS